jgi:hypothetical protein
MSIKVQVKAPGQSCWWAYCNGSEAVLGGLPSRSLDPLRGAKMASVQR